MATKKAAQAGANRSGLVIGIAVVAVNVVAGGAYLLMAGEGTDKPATTPGPMKAKPVEPGEMADLTSESSRRAPDDRRAPRTREERRPDRRSPAVRPGGGGPTPGSKAPKQPKKRRPRGQPGIL